MGKKVIIRTAAPPDCERLAALSGQLGYPASPEQTAARLGSIQADKNQAVFVAEENGHVVGWLQVCKRCLLVDEPLAEIEGLVVDEAHRGRRIGQVLLEHAENWARQNGCVAVFLRSNVMREVARHFYERLGYLCIKTQRAFRKDV